MRRALAADRSGGGMLSAQSSENVSGLYAAAYEELLRVARRQRRRFEPSDTLCTTALVHEAYFKLRDQQHLSVLPQHELLAITARAMRQVLVDHARRAFSGKRFCIAVTLSEAVDVGTPPSPVSLFDLHDAIQQLERVDPQLSRIVDLHVFSGMEFGEIASNEGISERGVFRLWRRARVFLLDALSNA
jgi:RNA polymerase sigma factor (TIGR02999 family)